MDVGVYDTRPDAIDANAFLGDFQGQPPGQRVDGAFGRRIIEINAGAAKSRRAY